MERVIKRRGRPLLNIGKVRAGLLLAWLLLLLLLLAGGCTATDVEEHNIPAHALKDVEAGFNLNVLASRAPLTRSITFTPAGTIETDSVPAAVKDTLLTRASSSLTEAQESQISSLWVGQYDANGKHLFSKYFASLSGTKVSLKLKQNPADDDSKSRVYFVANAGDLGKIAEEAALKIHKLPYNSTSMGLPDNNLCKMTGLWEGVVTVGGVKDITVELTRLVARISFTYAMGPDFSFTPTSVVLENAPDKSQIGTPVDQLSDINYKTYTGTSSGSGATVYWYLPENMAGTAKDPDAVDSEKKKIGNGVKNATSIKLTGNAVQGGVTYKNVTFRFYPGSDMNNYDILRNAHYTMDVTLKGIDISDERITVGTIPPIVVDPTEMLAKKGGEKEIQITARPGQEWVFDMPEWLSALIGDKNIPAGATITYQGPATVKFMAVAANPKAEKRTASFEVEVNEVKQAINITQSGSTLTVGGPVSLTATKDSEGSSSFTATEGLPWSAVLSGGGDWLIWSGSNPGTSGNEAPAVAQTLSVKATKNNPSSRVRAGKITVKAGASVGDAAYTSLTQEIAVEQAGSTFSVSDQAVTLPATSSTGHISTFTAPSGLSWNVGVTSTGGWLSLTSPAGGIDNTTGSAQNIRYDATTVNPYDSPRQGMITVKVGDAVSGTDAGLTKTISITQEASTITTTNGAADMAPAAKSTTTGSVTATAGLAWTIAPESHNGITVSPTSGIGNQTLTFTTEENTSIARTGTFLVSVTGTSPVRTETVSATQRGTSIGNVQVCKTENSNQTTWTNADTYCKNLITEGKNDWRIPLQKELETIVRNKAALEEVNGFKAFLPYWYWVSEDHSNSGWKVLVNANSFSISGDLHSTFYNSRCVRTIK